MPSSAKALDLLFDAIDGGDRAGDVRTPHFGVFTGHRSTAQPVF
jgi:hypothetical protein